ncbi:MAG: Rrf2 family transcriptional regulator [Candidatus Methylomirabilales bacterium]
MLSGSAVALATRAALFLALQPPDRLAPIHEIARSLGLPRPYLAKVIQQLTAAGLVVAQRGPGGGLRLARPPRAISLWDVVRAVEGPSEVQICALGLQACGDEHPCPLHDRWSRLRAQIHRLLGGTTLQALARGGTAADDGPVHAWLRVAGNGAGSRRPSGTKHVTPRGARQGGRGSRHGSPAPRVSRRPPADR